MLPPEAAPAPNGRLLIAGVGNPLRGDDGFGIEVARRLQLEARRAEVRVIEVGIGGISLVQELMTGYDVLVVADAIHPPGESRGLTLRTLEIPDLHEVPEAERLSCLADTHYANPSRALMLARAVGVLPPQVYLIGVEIEAEPDFGTEMSPAGEAAVEAAVDWLRRWLARRLVQCLEQPGRAP